MILTTLAAPAAEPVSLAEAKDYLRIGGDGEDGLVGSMIAGARARIEALANVAMITRTLRVTMDWWPRGAVEKRTVVMPVRPTMRMRWMAPEHQRYMGYHRQRFLTGP